MVSWLAVEALAGAGMFGDKRLSMGKARVLMTLKVPIEITQQLVAQRLAGAWLEPRGLGEVHPEPVASALIPAGHLGAGVAELLLDMTLVDLG